MEERDYLRYIVDEFHTVVVATVDREGFPVTAAIDMMDADDNSLYFLTAKGKGFYDRLKEKKFLAFTAIKGEETMSRVALSVRGKVRELGSAKISELFEKNTYMFEIYPTDIARKALTVFQIYEGTGEWFDLSKKPIERAYFSFGIEENQGCKGYFITESCIGCDKCIEVCPQKCIVSGKIPYAVQQRHCLHCGNCLTVCPVGAVERREVYAEK